MAPASAASGRLLRRPDTGRTGDMEDSPGDNLTTRSLLKGILATEPVRTQVTHRTKRRLSQRPSASYVQEDESSSSPALNLRSKMRERARRSVGKSALEVSVLKKNVETNSKSKRKPAKKGSHPVMEDLDTITPRTLLRKIIQNEDEVSIVVSQRPQAAAADDKPQEDVPTERLSSLGSVNLSLPDLQDTEHVTVFKTSRKKKRKMRVSEFEREVDERLPKKKDKQNISNDPHDNFDVPSLFVSSYSISGSTENKLDFSAAPESTFKRGLLRRPNKVCLVSLDDFEQGVEDKYQQLKGSQECFIEPTEGDKSDANEMALLNTVLYAQSLHKEANVSKSDRQQKGTRKHFISSYEEIKEADNELLEPETKNLNANVHPILNAQTPKDKTSDGFRGVHDEVIDDSKKGEANEDGEEVEAGSDSDEEACGEVLEASGDSGEVLEAGGDIGEVVEAGGEVEAGVKEMAGDSGEEDEAAGDNGEEDIAAGDSGEEVVAAGDSGEEDVAAGDSGEEDVAAGDSGEEDVAAGDSGEEDVGAGDSGEEDVAAGDSGEEDVAAGDSGEEDVTAGDSGEADEAAGDSGEADEAAGDSGEAAGDSGEEDVAAGDSGEEDVAAGDSGEEDVAAGDSGEADVTAGDSGEEDVGAGDSGEADVTAGDSGEADVAAGDSGEEDEAAGDSGEAAGDSGEEDEAAGDSGEEDEAAGDSGEEDEAAGDSGEEDEAAGDSGEEDVAAGDSGEEDVAAGDSGEEDVAAGDSGEEDEAAGDSGEEDEAAGDSGKGKAGDDLYNVQSSMQQNKSSLFNRTRKSAGVNEYSHRMQETRLDEENGRTAESIYVHTVSRPRETSEPTESSGVKNLDVAISRGMAKKKETNKLMLSQLPETPAYIKLARFVSSAQPAVSKKIQRKRSPKAKKLGSVFSSSQVKQIFTHHSQVRVSKDALEDVEKCLDLYMNQLAVDLSTYSAHANRKTVTRADLELLMKRQRLVTDVTSLNVLIEKHLPLECRSLLIPCATSGNKVFPKM